MKRRNPGKATNEICEATAGGRIELADNFEIEDYEKELAVLLEDVLGLDPRSCFVSDASDLSDFAFSGAGFERLLKAESHKAELKHWDVWVTEKIRIRFGVAAKATDNVLEICRRIRASGIPAVGLN